MSESTSISRSAAAFSADYAALLKTYLEIIRGHGTAHAREEALQGAYDLSRKAMAEGLGVLDLAAAHHAALEERIADGSLDDQERTVREAGTFFIESLSPYEMTHRSFSESKAALRSLNNRLEQEAARIAHSLHAEAGQLIVSGHLAINRLESDLSESDRARLAEVRSYLDQVHLQLRQISHELRPTILDELGLMPALRFLAEGMAERSGIEVVVKGHLPRLETTVEISLYRVVQEALNNIVKHSGARQAVITVAVRARRLNCTIKDDGRGFDLHRVTGGSRTGLGLPGIRERLDTIGGTLIIDATPGRGTTLVIQVPLEE